MKSIWSLLEVAIVPVSASARWERHCPKVEAYGHQLYLRQEDLSILSSRSVYRILRLMERVLPSRMLLPILGEDLAYGAPMAWTQLSRFINANRIGQKASAPDGPTARLIQEVCSDDHGHIRIIVVEQPFIFYVGDRNTPDRNEKAIVYPSLEHLAPDIHKKGKMHLEEYIAATATGNSEALFGIFGICNVSKVGTYLGEIALHFKKLAKISKEEKTFQHYYNVYALISRTLMDNTQVSVKKSSGWISGFRKLWYLKTTDTHFTRVIKELAHSLVDRTQEASVHEISFRK